jgi:hypothetical protein
MRAPVLCRRRGATGHQTKRCGRGRYSGASSRDVRIVAAVTVRRLAMDPLGIARSTYLVNDGRRLQGGGGPLF